MKQQLVFLREQAQQRTHADEPLTLRLQAQQRLRLQQQLQQVCSSASTHLSLTEVTLWPDLCGLTSVTFISTEVKN